jgi:hypothetical protein
MENSIKQQIRLLRMVAECPPDGTIVAAKDDPDWPYLMKWLRSGVIDGDCGAGAEGDVFFGPSLSERGISLLSSLEEQTSVGLIKKGRFGFYKWFFSSLGGAAIGYITRMLTE